MSVDTLIRFLHRSLSSRPWASIVAIAVLIALVGCLVYMTGGLRYVYSHSMYIPVILAGFLFGVRGGFFAGLAGGIVLGPWMPIDTSTGEMQQTLNWIYRGAFFTLIGLLAGASRDAAWRYVRQLEWSATHDSATHLPNKCALERFLRGPRVRRGVLLMFGIENSTELASTFGFDVLDEIAAQLLQHLHTVLPPGFKAYRIDPEKIVVLLDDNAGEDAQLRLAGIAQILRDPFSATDLSLHADIRLGCAPFNTGEHVPADVMRKAHAALAAATRGASNLAVFADEQHGDSRESLRRLGELKEALAANRLTLHYQPKVDLRTG